MQADPTPAAVDLYRSFAEIAKPLKKESQFAPRERSTFVDRETVRRDQVLEVIRAQKSVGLAWGLSFFIGLGTGNFYADHATYGVLCLLGEVVGSVLAIAGVAANDIGIAVVGVVTNRSAWLADWIGAIVNAQEFNEQLVNRLAAARPQPGLLSWSF